MKKYPLGLAIVLALGTYAFSQYQAPAPAPSASSTSASQSASPDKSATQVDDQTLNLKLHQQFDTNPALKNVEIKVFNGTVDLAGTVPSKDDRRRAKEMARAVPGVRSVREKISVATGSGGNSSKIPDHTAMSEAAHNTAGSIAGNSDTTSASTAGQTATSPGVTPANGEATGIAPTANSGEATGGITGRANATGVATDRTGSTSNTGPVGAPIAGAAGKSITATEGETSTSESIPEPDTSTLRSELVSAFQAEPTLSTSHINVNVTGSTIELTGSVPTPKDHLTAKRIAQSYAGNLKVEDKLSVAGQGSSNPGMASPSSTNTGTGMNNGINANTPATDNQQMTPPADRQKTQSDQSTTTPR